MLTGTNMAISSIGRTSGSELKKRELDFICRNVDTLNDFLADEFLPTDDEVEVGFSVERQPQHLAGFCGA